MKRRMQITMGLMLGALVLIVLFFVIFMQRGSTIISLNTIKDAFFHFQPENTEHLLIRDARVPQALGAIIVGGALAAAGCVMQGLTRNPMADSGFLGLNAGAGFAIAVCVGFFPFLSYFQMIMLAFVGAAFGVLSVLGLDKLVSGGNAAMNLVLAGLAISTLLTALSQGIAIGLKVTQSVQFWTMGSVSGVSWLQVKWSGLFIGIGLVIALLISRQLTLLNLGEETAQGLGGNTRLTKLLGLIAVILLSGASVAIAGSIAFIGLMVPHFVRLFTGSDYRLLLPASIALGAVLLLIANQLSVEISRPSTIPIGAITSFIGAPVFIYFIQRRKKVRS